MMNSLFRLEKIRNGKVFKEGVLWGGGGGGGVDGWELKMFTVGMFTDDFIMNSGANSFIFFHYFMTRLQGRN